MSVQCSRVQTVKKKSFIDYAPKSPPQGWTISYTGSLLATLKILGELPKISWEVCIFFLCFGLAYTLIHTAIRQTDNAND